MRIAITYRGLGILHVALVVCLTWPGCGKYRVKYLNVRLVGPSSVDIRLDSQHRALGFLSHSSEPLLHPGRRCGLSVLCVTDVDVFSGRSQ